MIERQISSLPDLLFPLSIFSFLLAVFRSENSHKIPWRGTSDPRSGDGPAQGRQTVLRDERRKQDDPSIRASDRWRTDGGPVRRLLRHEGVVPHEGSQLVGWPIFASSSSFSLFSSFSPHLRHRPRRRCHRAAAPLLTVLPQAATIPRFPSSGSLLSDAGERPTPHNPMFLGLLRRLHRGQPRRRWLRGTTTQAIPRFSPLRQPPFQRWRAPHPPQP
jgi:hypothetical protein